MFDNRDIILFSEPAPQVSKFRTPEEKCINGRPIQTFYKYFGSEESSFSVGVWECEVGSFKVDFTGHEFACLLEGRIMLEDEYGRQLHFVPGMQIMIPAGYKGIWNVLECARKSYVWYELGPVSY